MVLFASHQAMLKGRGERVFANEEMGGFSNTNRSESPAICFAFFLKKKKKSQNGASLHRRVMVLNKRQRGTEELAVRYFCRWKECTSL